MKKRAFFKTGSALALATLFGAFSALADNSHQFTIAVIPDTQNYCDTANSTASPQPASTQIYQREMQYLTNQITAQNLVFVTHVGDVVQHGDLYDGEWQNAKSAMDILAASGIPFGMTPGNHDYDNYSHTTGSRPLTGSVKWNQYFGPSSSYFSGKSWFGGSFSDPASSGISTWQTFSAGGKTFLHISLEMEASDATLTWATSVITSHPGMPTIVTTHEYLSYQNDANSKAIRLSDGYMTGEANNQCQAVWDKFISQNDQIFLVLCGHNWSSTVNGVSNGENLRTDNNAFGHPVYQVLSDYQGNTFDTNGTPGVLTGGAGWVRLMTFDTLNRTIHFKTYSSELNQYAGVAGGPTFNLPASMSDFTLAIPDRVFSAWKFGITSDTQWTVADDGKNPNTIAANIIKQLDSQFISAGVKLVIAVGDMADNSSANTATYHTNDYVRALYAQDLYNAGIAFYPARGNHEAANSTYTGSGADFRHAYPQIVPGVSAGWNNSTPVDITTSLVSPAADLANNPPATATGSPFSLGINFSAPTAANLANDSVSYAFDYNNVTFMLVDQFQSPDYYTSHIPEQMDWINGTLSVRPANTHAFVFTHKNMLGGNHKDNMFGGQVDGTDPGDCAGVNYGALTSANQAAFVAKTSLINSFIGTMQSNSVKFVISGHDHHHYNSIVTSPDQQSKVHQLICASDSSKFYTPATPISTNDLPVEQQLSRVGYYLFIVDGPRMTVDYYADTTANNYSGPFNFTKQSSTGYSLNGQEFVIPEGATYTTVADTTAKAVANGESGYLGTTMRILGNTNSSTSGNNYGKKWSKAVNTGWAPNLTGLANDVLTIWGLQQVGATSADIFPLSVSYNTNLVTAAQAASGAFALVSKDGNGNWVNAVTLNTGGTPQFVFGPWNSSYPLGTYGVDTSAQTVWAVVNHQGSFAAGVGQLEQPVTLAGPSNGTTVTNGYPTLAWTSVPGATGYQVALVGPKGTNYYTTTGTSLPLSLAQNGAYSWTVTPVNGASSGPVSAANTFSVASAGAWKFGVIDDTQWTCSTDPAGLNPNGVPVSIINQINPQFINAGVKFVVQVGDLTENGNDADEAVRAAAAQPLLNAGIGFFPMRGNHETYASPANSYAIPAFQADYPQTRGLTNTFGAANFSSPIAVSTDLNGMSYSFDFGTPDSNARFVILDNWVTPSKNIAPGNGYNYGYSFGDQQDWITGQLNKNTRGAQHAFVFSHQPLIAENHQDSPFVGMTDANTNMQNTFFASLATNNVKYYISGHDHIHQHSIITSPDGLSQVEEIIGASDSSKFYTPKATNQASWFGQKVRELSLSQERYTVGYYIYTVDGPRVTVDYYSDDHGNWASDNAYPTNSAGFTVNVTPTFHFVKKETFGYSLNGQSFLVAQGQAYTNVQDSIATGNGYLGTAAKILGGVNTSTTLDGSSRPLTKEVSTGWTPANATASDILTLWGMKEVGTGKADTSALSVSYNPATVTPDQLANGSFALVSKDANGNWTNAVSLNTGGNPQFVFGPYVSSYPLGTYGVDANAGTVWAVVNYQGSFAAGPVVRRTNLAALRIATLSDIHYFATNLLVSNGPAFQAYLAQDRKLLAESAAIAKASVDAVIAQEPDILLVSGDLTKDGEYDSHVGVSNLLARAAASGTLVYVIPGNHDVNNANAMSFNGSTAAPVANVTPGQFSAIYAPFGYNSATTVARDPNSLAYVVEPVPGLWLLCMDSCQYTVGQNPTEGSFTPQRLNWITNELAYAQAHGKVVIGMMHHGLMEHFAGQKTLFPEYVVDNYQTIAPLFASYGMKVVFTGHFHAQDIVQGTFNGNTIYDIETGSTVTYPCPYRLIDLMPNGQFAINSHRITAINYNLGSAPNFQTYAYNYLTNGMVPLSAYMLQAAPFFLDSATASFLAPAVSEAMVDHYIGDEPGLGGASFSTQITVFGLLAGSVQEQMIGGAIASILTDLAPADNNLTLSLTAGEITGPSTNTIVTAGSPTLTWAPVWGASSYHVTVSGPGYSRSFDVTGTRLALTDSLVNGTYSWTVTPNNGTVSSAGTFALDYQPTLAIEPATNGYVHVYWPVSPLSGYQLQFSPDLSGTNWVNVSSNGFFRLVR